MSPVPRCKLLDCHQVFIKHKKQLFCSIACRSKYFNLKSINPRAISEMDKKRLDSDDTIESEHRKTIFVGHSGEGEIL